MNQVLLSNSVIAILFAETILFFLSIVLFIGAIKIYLRWDINSFSNTQYALEKQNYFTATAILFMLILKIFLFVYFATTIDELSNIVPGAMCGAGVISVNEYGMGVFVAKLLIVFLAICWMIANAMDIEMNYLYTKRKYILFFIIFLLIVAEYILLMLYFFNISLELPVACCSVIYGTSDVGSTIPLSLNHLSLSLVFIIVSLMLLAANYAMLTFVSFVLGGFYLYFGYYFILHILGIYVYELPTHICPFCMLQQEYYYVGYFIWAMLFLGSLYAMAPLLLGFLIQKVAISKKSYIVSSVCVVVLGVVALCYVVGYYLNNGVWL